MTGDSGELGSRAPRAWAAVDHHDAAAASSGLRDRVGPGPPGPGPNPPKILVESERHSACQ